MKASVFTLMLSLTLVSARANSSEVTLCSPWNGDRFEVSRPMLFWQSSVGADHYEIFVDDKSVARVTAAPVPVMRYAVRTPLPPGIHHWFVKASASGDEISSSDYVFTVEAQNHWPAWAIGPFIKYGCNPILRPEGTGWEDWNVYNPRVIFDKGRFRMLYRGQENIKVDSDTRTLSRLGYAEGVDGVTFLRNADPVIDATEPFETRYGCEDARLVKYRGVYYAFYTGNLNAHSGKICLCEATSTDCIHWEKLGIIETGTKNGAIVRNPAGTPPSKSRASSLCTPATATWVCAIPVT